MDKERYDVYARRFNEQDLTVFDEYISPDMKMLNGTLEFQGIEGMKEHYGEKIWPYFTEELHIERFVSDESNLAVQMWVHFTARADGETLFGYAKAGETFDFRGIVFYEIEGGRFTKITVAYNSFLRTTLSGKVIDMGMPH